MKSMRNQQEATEAVKHFINDCKMSVSQTLNQLHEKFPNNTFIKIQDRIVMSDDELEYVHPVVIMKLSK